MCLWVNFPTKNPQCLRLPPEAGGEDFELFAVFGDGAAGNVESLLAEGVADFLVGEWFLFVFGADDFGEGIFDGGIGNDASVGLHDAGGEEISKFECSLRRGHVFAVAGAADGGFVDFDDVGHPLHGEGFEAADSFF